MKTCLGALLAAVCLITPLRAELPGDLDELKAMHAEQGKTPEGALKLWFDACFVYMNPETREVGAEMIQYLTIPFKEKPNWDEEPTNRLFVERLKDPGKQFIFRSYAKGTSPDNGYEMDPNEWELNWERNHQLPDDPRGLQCYVRSTGADNPRPVYMKQSTTTELWYVNLHLNVYTEVRPPKTPGGEEFR